MAQNDYGTRQFNNSWPVEAEVGSVTKVKEAIAQNTSGGLAD